MLLLLLLAAGSRPSLAPLRRLFECLRTAVSPRGRLLHRLSNPSYLRGCGFWSHSILSLESELCFPALSCPADAHRATPGRSALPAGDQCPSFAQNREAATSFGVSLVLCLRGRWSFALMVPTAKGASAAEGQLCGRWPAPPLRMESLHEHAAQPRPGHGVCRMAPAMARPSAQPCHHTVLTQLCQ